MSQISFVNALDISSWEDVDGPESFTSCCPSKALQSFLAVEHQRLGGVSGFQGENEGELTIFLMGDNRRRKAFDLQQKSKYCEILRKGSGDQQL